MEEPRWEPLGESVGVWTVKEHAVTTDALLLAYFSMPRPGDICADFGTGCGVIPLLWRLRGRPGPVLAIELQEQAAGLAARSVRDSGFSPEKLRVVCGDLRNYRELLPHQGLQTIACNPPYFPPGSGAPGKGPRKTARCGETLSLGDIARAAQYSLREMGRLSFCLPTSRMPEAFSLFSACGLEPKRLRLVQYSPEKAPYLFLLECRKGGKPGLMAEPVLCLTDGEGNDTPQLLEFYGAYRK